MFTVTITDRNNDTTSVTCDYQFEAIRLADEESRWESCDHVEVKNDTGAVVYRVEGDFS